MSQADKLLESLGNNDISTLSVNPETEGHIVVGDDRFITVPHGLKRIAVQFDHNVETVTFDCPRYWDGIDMSEMIVYINYMLPDGTPGSHIASNITTDGDIMHFDWTITREVTNVKGNLMFLVCVKTTDENGIEVNHWNSELCRDMYVSEGLECAETILHQYPDIVTQLLTRMAAVEEVQDIAVDAANRAEESATGIEDAESMVTRMYKEITNVRYAMAVEVPSETDASVAYSKTVPDNVAPYAEIVKIGGMTRKCTNLFDDNILPTIGFTKVTKNEYYNESLSSVLGKNIFVNTQRSMGSFTISGQLKYVDVGVLSSGIFADVYYTDGTRDELPASNRQYGVYFDYSVTTNPNKTVDYIRLTFGSSKVSTYIKDFQINEGTTALPYEPYFEGLRSAPVTEIESVGTNLCHVANITTAEIPSGRIEFFDLKKHGTYTLSCDVTKFSDDTATNTRSTITVTYTDGTRTEGASEFDLSSAECDGVARRKIASVTTDPSKTIALVYVLPLNYSELNTRNAKAENIQLEFGASATEYTPYVKTTLPMPAELLAIDGYGDGFDDSCCNCVDLKKRQFAKRVGKVDMGTLAWNVTSGYESRFNAFITNSPDIKETTSNVICSKYSRGGDKKVFVYENRIYVDDSTYTDVATFKAAMSGVILLYELATPEIIDISHILPADNLLAIQARGTLTPVNEHKYAVPWEVKYTANGFVVDGSLVDVSEVGV